MHLIRSVSQWYFSMLCGSSVCTHGHKRTIPFLWHLPKEIGRNLVKQDSPKQNEPNSRETSPSGCPTVLSKIRFQSDGCAVWALHRKSTKCAVQCSFAGVLIHAPDPLSAALFATSGWVLPRVIWRSLSLVWSVQQFPYQFTATSWMAFMSWATTFCLSMRSMISCSEATAPGISSLVSHTFSWF